MRSALENALALLLRHASQHSEHLAFSMLLLELLQAVKHLLLGLVPNAAGVVKNQIGLFRRTDLIVAFRNQRADNFFRIVHIHLAPKGLDIKSLHGIGFDSIVTRLQRASWRGGDLSRLRV